MANNPNIIVVSPRGTLWQDMNIYGETKIRLEWNPGFGPRFTKLLQSGQAKLDQEVMKQMEPYMQLDTAAMIMSMRLSTEVGSGKIDVTAPYSRKVHYSLAKVGRITGPLRGPFFFRRMKADRLPYLLQFARGSVGAK